MAAPSTRILSFRQMVLEADPNWLRQSLQPWAYQYSNNRLFIDPSPLYSFGSFGTLSIVANVLHITANPNWPTSALTLAPGDVWSNGGIVTIVGPFTPNPLAARLLYAQTNGFQLLQTTGADLPTSSAGAVSTQLWNNRGVVNVVP